jgi:perosamine synthetase
MEKKFIPLCTPNISGNEWKYVKDCLDTGWISSVGAYVNQFEAMTAAYVGVKHAVAVVNGTNALHICLVLAGVKQRDYVIMPNITFIATANSIKYTGADLILIDADPQTWQMDLDLLEEFLSKKTMMKDGFCYLKKDKRRISTIMPVHVLGNMGDMERFMALASKYNLFVVEDSTEALGTRYKGKHAGTFGQLGSLSYNGNKLISTGGGGMIITDSDEYAKKAKHLTTQAKSDPFEYIHDEIGYNYRLVNVLAAIGVAQMEQLDKFIARKKEAVQYYKSQLKGLADITFQEEIPEVESNGWLFTIRTKHQRAILKALNENNCVSRPFWVPMNQLQMFKDDIYITKKDNSNHIYNSCLSIPCSTGITDEEMEIVVNIIKKAV